MTKARAKKPTNKERDKAIGMHDAYLREIGNKFNALYNQVQDFFAVFSMYVEYCEDDEEFGKFVESKIKEAKANDEKAKKKTKILDKSGNTTPSSSKDTPDTVPVNKVVDK
jgi:hypothetical protein